MSKRQRRTREKRRRHAAPAGKRVRSATLSGSLAATAALGLAVNGETASFQTEAAEASGVDPGGSLRQAVAAGLGTGETDRLTFASSVTGTTGVGGPRTADGVRSGPLPLLGAFDAELVKNINLNPSTGSYPSGFAGVNGTGFFYAADGPDNGTTHGYELWKSNGTGAGTELVKDIYPGGSGYPRNLTNVNGTLFFSAYTPAQGYELWKSEPPFTDASTQPVKDIRAGAMSSNVGSLRAVGDTLFFTAHDGTHGQELWKSDGTATGTTMVDDDDPADGGINPGAPGSYPGQLTAVNGALLFAASEGATSDRELWKSDGTAGGTRRVEDIRAGDTSSHPIALRNANGTLFFRADDGSGTGSEPWKSEAPFTDATTSFIKDVRPGANSSGASQFTAVDGSVVFSATDDGPDFELFRTDGTEANTQQVEEINATGSANPQQITRSGGTVFFRATDGPDDGTTHGYELWKSDGTAAGTHPAKDINPSGNSVPSGLADFNGTLFFRANDGTTGSELWKSDGAPAGTELVRDINPTGNSTPIDLASAGGSLFFQASDGTNGAEPWRAFAVPATPPPPGAPPGGAPPAGPLAPSPTAAEDPKCAKLRQKLERQERRLKRADRETKRSMIKDNMRDTKERLRKLLCRL